MHFAFLFRCHFGVQRITALWRQTETGIVLFLESVQRAGQFPNKLNPSLATKEPTSSATLGN